MADRASSVTFTDLEVRIFQRQDQGYPVEITLGGQQEYPRGYLPTTVLPWSSSGDLVQDGQALFDKLFADKTLLSAWAEARGRAPQRRIRFRIDPQAAELHIIPWELLQDQQAMIAAQDDTPFSRYLPIALPWSGAVDQRPIKVLVAISNPDDLQEKYDLVQADVAQERKALEDAFATVDANELQVTFMAAPITLERIEAELRQGYHIFHYVGHGSYSSKRQQASLYLQDTDGHTQQVDDTEIVAMVARQGVRPHLVFLAACQSAVRSSADAFVGLAPKLIWAGVPAVVAMQDFVKTETARQYSRVFYQQLIEHGQIDRAGNQARSALLSAGRPDAIVPVVFMRLKSAQLWSSEVDARGAVLGAKTPRVFWKTLMTYIQNRKCTPVIGPRVYGRWLPTRNEVAQLWARENDYPFGDKVNLARVAQYIASNSGEDFTRQALKDTLMKELRQRLPPALRPAEEFNAVTELVKAVGFQNLVADDPNEVHRVLAALNLPLYLTTNYVSFMTEALEAAKREPIREVCHWYGDKSDLPSVFDADYQPTPEKPLIYHFFGVDDEPESIVLTEDNYFDWLVKVSAEPERIPDVIKGKMTTTSLLFLGYNLHDIEFRVIMRGLIATRPSRKSDIRHVAVQMDVDDVNVENNESVQGFLQQYFQSAEINVYWGSVEQFMGELREQWEATTQP